MLWEGFSLLQLGHSSRKDDSQGHFRCVFQAFYDRKICWTFALSRKILILALVLAPASDSTVRNARSSKNVHSLSAKMSTFASGLCESKHPSRKVASLEKKTLPTLVQNG